jgi:hypothetical protein
MSDTLVDANQLRKDYADVVNMVRAGVIELQRLEQYFEEVLPQIDSFSLRADPENFKRKFELFKKRCETSS